jgi:hypoxanthine phosphoribosyltransferase
MVKPGERAAPDREFSAEIPLQSESSGENEARAARVVQPALPMLRQVLRPVAEEGFAHPAEEDLSRLLSYYGIRWVYEPTTFALAWTEDGRPAELFTPDFYLPEHRLYIELTTMRQRLVTRKNRKLRRLRELYPNVQIKLLYRRDYLRLCDAYPERAIPDGVCQLGPVLFAPEAIAARVAGLADRLVTDLQGGCSCGCGASGEAEAAPPLVVGVGRGSRRFHAALITAIAARGLVAESDDLELSRYRIAGGARRVRVCQPPRASVAGRRVVLVEDIVSTGLSLAYLVAWLRRRGAAAVEVCTLLDRRSARLVEVAVRYAGFEAPRELLVGYGLSLRRQFSDLPFIATLEPT